MLSTILGKEVRWMLKRVMQARAEYEPTKPLPSAAYSANAFGADRGRWWPPQLGGPSSLLRASQTLNAIRECRTLLDILSSDTYLEYVKAFYDSGLARWGSDWEYHDINTVLFTASRILEPKCYMEIGVRRGRSAATVLTQQPHCEFVGFDLWLRNYAGMENPGPEFVDRELERIGHVGRREYVSGDSRITVPAYFSSHPHIYFDIITVDGDHTVGGARADIKNCMQRLKVGGVLVFDDTCNPSHPGLCEVWNECMAQAHNYESAIFNEVGFGVAVGIRKY
jgi:predicted O-methyltransferase YrrM